MAGEEGSFALSRFIVLRGGRAIMAGVETMFVPRVDRTMESRLNDRTATPLEQGTLSSGPRSRKMVIGALVDEVLIILGPFSRILLNDGRGDAEGE